MNPRVSICMPAFNVGRFIQRAITSLLAQTFTDFELLVLDDGSTDDTWKIASQCGGDPRLRLMQNERNMGLVISRNRLQQEARGALLALADSDDIFVPTRIEQQVAFMDTHPEVGIVGANVEFISLDGRPLRNATDLPLDDSTIRFFLMLGPCLANTVTMYRRQLLDEVGGYHAGFNAGAEDYDLWCRLSKITKLANLKQVLATMHVHGGSVTSSDAGAKANIYRVAQVMLSDYMATKVSEGDARDLLAFFWHGLGYRADPSNIFSLARKLRVVAAKKEEAETYDLLRVRMHEALWKLAQALVYANRAGSFQAMKDAISLSPRALATPSFAKYAGRLLTPPWVRAAFKRRLKKSD